MLKEYTTMTLIIFFWLVIGSLNLQVIAAPMDENQTDVSTTPPQPLKDFEKQIDELIGYITKTALPYFVQNADAKISTPCTRSIIRMFTDVKRLKFSVLKLMDSMGKPVSGLLQGSFAMMGDYEECLSVSVSKTKVPSKDPKDELYHGAYCTVGIRMPPALIDAIDDYSHGRVNASQLGKLHSIIENMPLKSFAREYFGFNFGACVPSTCSTEDLETMISLVGLPFPVEVKRCETRDSKTITYDQIVILTLFGLLLLLVLAGTAADGILYLKDDTYKGHHKEKLMQYLLCFSIYNNTKKFMRTQKDASSEVTCINGMYATGTFLVVVYHTYFVPFINYAYRHLSHIDDYFKDFSFTLISTMSISIEAYFLFSGFFLVYGRWTYANGRKVNISIFRLIVQRYLRLTPSMLFILGIILVLPVFGSGPIWHDIADLAAENTRIWWWKYVIQINNFLLPKDQNYLYLWFVPCLMQITVIGIFLAWLLSRKPKLGVAMTILTGIACNIGMGIMTYQMNYPPSYAIYFLTGRDKYEVAIYLSPLSHISSFLIGMLLAYYMSQNKDITFKPVTVVIGWIMCLALTVGTQLVMYVCHEGIVPNRIFASIYAATHRTAFSLGMVWLIIACTHGYAGALGKVLCWKGFGPLSKLGYSGYLVHYLVLAYHISSVRTPMMYSHLEIWMRIAGYSGFTYAFGYLMYVTFELPLQFFESRCFPKKTELKVNSANGTIENGTEKMNGKEKISDVTTVSSISVQPGWALNGIYKETNPENSKL